MLVAVEKGRRRSGQSMRNALVFVLTLWNSLNLGSGSDSSESFLDTLIGIHFCIRVSIKVYLSRELLKRKKNPEKIRFQELHNPYASPTTRNSFPSHGHHEFGADKVIIQADLFVINLNSLRSPCEW